MERTLTILKPDCVRKQLIGAVIDKIERAGFRVVAMKKIKLTKETAWRILCRPPRTPILRRTR